MHSDHFGSIWINGIVQFLLGEALSWQYKAAVVDTHFESRLYASWVVPPCSLQFFLPISLIEALCRCFVFPKVVGHQPFKKNHIKDSKKTAGCNNHKQPSAWNHSPPATTHWLKGTTPKRPSHVPPVTRRVSVSPWWRALWRRGQRLGRWRPMKTGDFIRKTMGFTLWLCQNSYWTWPSRNSGFTLCFQWWIFP